jgi:hypothetical protein
VPQGANPPAGPLVPAAAAREELVGGGVEMKVAARSTDDP